MRLIIPITGNVLAYDPVSAEIDGIGIVGDPNDPVRIINIDLGNVSWRLVTIDLESDLAEIEVSPGETVSQLKDGGNPNNPEGWLSRQATEQEKQAFLNYAKNLVESHMIDDLYTMSKSNRLVKPAESVEFYKQRPPNVEARLRLIGGI